MLSPSITLSSTCRSGCAMGCAATFSHTGPPDGSTRSMYGCQSHCVWLARKYSLLLTLSLSVAGN